MHLVEAFAALGYASYRLVPGLDLLVPFNPEERVDGFLLNLFCCKPDRSARLAARGVLLDSAELESAEEEISHLVKRMTVNMSMAGSKPLSDYLTAHNSRMNGK